MAKLSQTPRPETKEQAQSLFEVIPFVDYRQHTTLHLYPEDRRFVYMDYNKAVDKNLKIWYYAEDFARSGPAFALLPPDFAAINCQRSLEDERESGRMSCFTRERKYIHFGFDNMWNGREPVFVLTDQGEVKLWWQAKGVPLHQLKPPEKCKFLVDAISPQLFLHRLTGMFGLPPKDWPLKDPDSKEVRWCAMLTNKAEEQVLFRVLWTGRLQIAYNGSTWGMYDIIELLQVLMGPPGDELYADKSEAFESFAARNEQTNGPLIQFVPGVGPVPNLNG